MYERHHQVKIQDLIIILGKEINLNNEFIAVLQKLTIK